MADTNDNTGHRNTGYYNTGHYNTGHRNTGDYNTGHYNTGHRNTGYYNTGYYNTGHRNTGFFCTETPKPMFFDLPWDGTWEQAYELIPAIDLPIGAEFVAFDKMSDDEKKANPNHATIGGYLKANKLTIQQAFPLVWAKLDEAVRQQFLNLPNFDAEKFLACTGVDVRKPEEPQEITVNGKRYRRVD